MNAALTSIAAVFACMTVLWVVSLKLKDSSIVDIFWGLGFVLIGWIAFFTSDGRIERRVLVAAATTIWGVRLAGYLAWRNLGKGEDPRYRAMREKHGSAWPMRSLFIVFGLQGALMLLVALPLFGAHAGARALSWLDGVGVLLWLTGVIFESVGDLQLARFKQNPANRGRVMAEGLWRYTRHPNYFGDFMVWWGLYCFALSAGAWWTIFGPALMSWLLMRFSGVPMLESAMRNRPGFTEYMRRTSAFFPRPPSGG